MPYTFQIILYYVILLITLYLIKTRNISKILKYKTKIIAIILIIVIVPNIIEKIPQSKLKVYFIDVGQGDSCLVITPKNKKILVDGGGSENYDIRRENFSAISVK